MKQTAVEWLEEQLEINNYISENAHWLIDDAKEMEKQQKGYSLDDLKEAFSMGRVGKTIKDFNEQFKNK